jgi:MFS family permease
MIGSFYQLGILIGTFTFGVISDSCGRMLAFKCSILLVSVSSVSLLLSFHPYYIAGSLFVLGIGAGAELSLGSIVFYEFCPPSKRYYLAYLVGSWGIGGGILYGAALIVSFTNNTVYGWRYSVGCGCILSIISLFFRYFIIETPAYCIAKGYYKQAEDTLSLISLQNTGKTFKFEDFDEAINSCNENLQESKDSNPKLFKGKNRKTALLLGLVIYI